MSETRKTRARRRILKLLTARELQQLSTYSNPHLAERAALEANILALWERQRGAIRQKVISIFNEAG